MKRLEQDTSGRGQQALWRPCGAELVIHGSDLRHRWAVVVGVIAHRGKCDWCI